MGQILYHRSGLLGISGISNDMRDLIDSREPAAMLAVDYFVYQAAKSIGALAAALQGVDGIVFTAGIGENSAEVRRRICQATAWLGIDLDQDLLLVVSPTAPGQRDQPTPFVVVGAGVVPGLAESATTRTASTNARLAPCRDRPARMVNWQVATIRPSNSPTIN